MFRISFFCDDKKLAEALRSLAGVAAGAPDVQPVINAVKKNGKVLADGSGDPGDLFVKYVKDQKLQTVVPDDMRAFCKHIGRSPGSSQYFAKQMIGKGLMKRVGKGANVHYVLK